MRTNNYKDRLEELAEGYEEARDEAFDTEFKEEFKKHFGTKLGLHVSITEDDVQGFLDSWTFPNEADWCADEYQNELETIGDIKYQEMKDER